MRKKQINPYFNQNIYTFTWVINIWMNNFQLHYNQLIYVTPVYTHMHMTGVAIHMLVLRVPHDRYIPVLLLRRYAMDMVYDYFTLQQLLIIFSLTYKVD